MFCHTHAEARGVGIVLERKDRKLHSRTLALFSGREGFLTLRDVATSQRPLGESGENWWCHPVRKQDEAFIYSIYLFIQPHARVCDSHVIVNHVNKRLCSVQLRLLRFPRGSLFSISQHNLYFLCGIRVIHALRVQTAYRSETATRFTFSSTFQSTHALLFYL